MDVLELIEIRKAIDTHFLDAAMRNLTADDLAALSALDAANEGEERRPGSTISEEDYRFHRLLHQRSGNPLALSCSRFTGPCLYAAVDSEPSLH